MSVSTFRAMRRSTWLIMIGMAAAALLLAGNVASRVVVSLSDAQPVGSEQELVASGEVNDAVVSLTGAAANEGLVCGYVICEVELDVDKEVRYQFRGVAVKGAPGGLVQYSVTVDVPAGASGPVVIDSIIDDTLGDLSAAPYSCEVVGEVIDPDDGETCNVEVTLPVLEAGDSHTNTITVIGHVLGTNIQASGEDSATLSIVEPQIGIEATYSVKDGTVVSGCLSAGGTDEITVAVGDPVFHCVKVTNTGNTTIVSMEETYLGSTSTDSTIRYPKRVYRSKIGSLNAVAGTTVYEYKVVATDEWGNTYTDTQYVTVIGDPPP